MKSKDFTTYEFSEKEFLTKLGLEGKIKFITTNVLPKRVLIDIERKKDD